MISLLRKDLILLKKNTILSIPLVILISLLGLGQGVKVGIIYLICTLIAFLVMVNGNLVSDREQKATPLLLSLPISKAMFTFAKYISCLMAGVFIWLVASVIILASRTIPFFEAEITPQTLYAGFVITVTFILSLMSLILPVYYAFGYKAIRWVFPIPVILSSFGSRLVQSSFYRELVATLSQYSTEQLWTTCFVLSLILYALSYLASLTIVKNKNF